MGETTTVGVMRAYLLRQLSYHHERPSIETVILIYVLNKLLSQTRHHWVRTAH